MLRQRRLRRGFSSILTQEALGESGDSILQSRLQILAQRSLLVNRGQQIRLVGLQVCDEVGFPLEDLVDGDTVEVAVNTGIDEGNHFIDGHRRVLLLLQELGQLDQGIYISISAACI
jgi:hypothetical protein